MLEDEHFCLRHLINHPHTSGAGNFSIPITAGVQTTQMPRKILCPGLIFIETKVKPPNM